MALRTNLYRAARLLGDATAFTHNRVLKRIIRRQAGKFTARLLSKLFR